MTGKVAVGIVAFSNVTAHDVYNGKDTGYFNVTLALDPQEAAKLTDQGITTRDYEGTAQRKFKTQYPFAVVDNDDAPVVGEIPYGSEVKVLYTTGPAHPEYGAPTYLSRIRVTKLADGAEAPEEF